MKPRETFKQEFERLQTLLGLDQWDVDIEFVPALSDSWADIICNEQKDEATLRVGEDLLGRKWEKQQDTIVHELLHLMTRDMRVYMWRQLEELDVSQQARVLVRDTMVRQEEQLVDRLAHLITPLVS